MERYLSHSFKMVFGVLFVFPSMLISQELGVLANLEKDISRLIDVVKPSVVTVSARVSYSYLETSGSSIFGLGRSKEESATVEYTNVGSGIVFDKQGLILTKSSIVLGGHNIEVTFSDGRMRSAELLGHDRRTGLAVVKVAETQLHPALLGDSNRLRPGSWITIIGNSLGMSNAVSFGMVNSLRDDGLIQLSAALSPGNSGSPIFNVDGEVVGILSARVGGGSWPFDFSSAGFVGENAVAYPINQVRSLTADLAKYGTRPEGWMGVVADDLPGRRGLVHIRRVVTSSPANKAGLRVGDLIVGIDGKQFMSSVDIANMIKSSLPGDTVAFDILRGRDRRQINIVVEQNPDPDQSLGKPVLFSEPYMDQGIITTQWQLQSKNSSSGEVSLEFIMTRIHQLEQEIEMMKSMVQSQK